MGSVTRTKNKKGWFIDFRKDDRTRARETLSGTDKATAKMILADREKRERQVAEGIIPRVTSSVALEDLFTEFHAWTELYLRPKTITSYRASLERMLSRLPVATVADLKPHHVDNYMR